MPKVCIAHIRGTSPYSASRAHEAPREPKETPGDYDDRTWRQKLHVSNDGTVVIPAMAFKMALDTAAKMLGEKIPGKRNATYSKFFLAGVLVFQDPRLGIPADAVRGARVHANADGVRGSGKRVFRTFPMVDDWQTTVTFDVLADEITKDVFEKHLAQAGSFVGVGRFRPQMGGLNGRFVVDKVEWR